MNLDDSARSARQIFLFHERFLFNILNCVFLNFISLLLKKWGGGGSPALPLRRPCTVVKVFSGKFSKAIQHDGESLRT